MLKPPDLIGHVSLSLSPGGSAEAKEGLPQIPVASFQRMQDPKVREAHEVALKLPAQPSRPTDVFFSYSADELARDHAVFIRSADPTSQDSGVSLQVRVNELESEVTKLRQQLGKAKTINDTMWDAMVQKLGVKTREQENSEDGDGDDGENESRRKRGRS
ncbi:hypothetical protein EUX98_g3472 [Antrodiella citrinella]|uniref:Uncharacterized protein n=1 Tax=Antrodiella citrinella TaxID=2447956 RepID=A0A4S4MYI3_9APHY|nr:hypothetical protein EUX98_g3472 [Antrodiella citrinella]